MTTQKKVRAWIGHTLDSDVTRVLEKLAKDEDIETIAVMPDVHLASEFCVGSVIASKERLYPNAVGGDIGCGMSTVRFNLKADRLQKGNKSEALLKCLYQLVPKNKRQRDNLLELDPGLQSAVVDYLPGLESDLMREGVYQLGTMGGGNHFLEFQRDDEGYLWVMLHTGSRGFGQKLRNHFLPVAKKNEQGILYLDRQTEDGEKYLKAVEIGCDYALLNRKLILEVVCELMEQIFGCSTSMESHVDCHHNYVREESHDGKDLLVHRKGALSAKEGELGIIPGSMGTSSYHVIGKGCEKSLQSCSHGAGRKMSRGQARQRISEKEFKKAMKDIHFDERRARALLDEAPQAYKNIGTVMRAQNELVSIVREVKPILSYKGV